MRKPLRNPNGFGSVYKLPGRRRRPWIAIVTTEWTDNGKQVRQPIGYFKTKQEGMDALTLHRIGPVSPKADLTLEEIYEEWSEPKYKKLSHHTVSNYKTAWSYLTEYEKVKFGELRTGHWQQIIDKAAEKGLKLSALKKIRSVAAMLSDYAMQNDIIDKNYARFVKLPKFEKSEKDRFSDLEVKKIEEAAKKDRWVSVVLIMIYTGLRISELLRLTLFNVDLERQIITGGIKTEAGKDRIVPIHKKIKDHIQSWYNRGGDRLICKDNGSRMSADYFRKNYYYQALQKAGVRRLVPHTTRHTFGTMAAEAGVDPLYIQKLIGHADYAFTANEYTHPELEALRQAIDKI